MRLSNLNVAAMLILYAVAAPASVLCDALTSVTASRDTTLDHLQQQANVKILAALDKRHEKLNKRGQKSTCNSTTVVKRKEYGNLSAQEKTDYIKAVLCLQGKTALTPTSLVPGVRTRYDDFVATHINQTLTIHYTGNFLSWHRYYVWIYEQTLRNECGYTGYQPYWEWSKYVKAPQKSPLFDGSATSLSGNGAYIPGRNDTVLTAVTPSGPVAPLYLSPGLGGGCISTGPFANLTVNLGPLGNPNAVPGPDGGLGYNPRCLKRDINPTTAQRFNNLNDILNLLTQNHDIYDFQMQLQGVPGIGIGAHGGGHYTIGGDASDLFASPADPAFFLHHGQVDRMWTIWQSLDPEARTYALAQTRTYLDLPPSEDTTLDDIIELGYSGGEQKKIRELISVVQGDFCYIYV